MKAITQLKAGDSFDSLRPEPEQSRKDIEVTSNPALTFLAELYGKFCLSVPEYEKRSEHIDYNEHACFVIRDALESGLQGIRSKDLEYLLMAIPSYHQVGGKRPNSSIEYWGGVFVNACINHCNDRDITLCAGNLDFDDLGTYNEGKNIVVRGNVGSGIGTRMRAGRIDVLGGAQDFVGDCMYGGEIIIRGDVKSVSLGHGMKGGVIRVRGDVNGNAIGDAIGGSIRVQGNAPEKSTGVIYIEGRMNPEQISPDMLGGTLYHKGKLIVKDGVRIK